MRHFALLLLLPALASGQSPAPLAFEKADILISAPGTQEAGGFLPEGHFECRGATLLKLIALAYGVHTDAIQGGPDWLATDRFDILAKASLRQATPAESRQMLQRLLEERFALSAREEQRDMPVYLLTVKNGGKLQRAGRSEIPACPKADGDSGLNHRACRAYTMSDLAILLPQIARNYADRPVVDATRLAGAFNFDLDWMEKAAYLDAIAIGRPAVSLSDALSRLGLDLEPGTRPARAIVIDSVNRTPTPNRPPVPVDFDVAEIHKSRTPKQRRQMRALPDGQLELHGYTLRELMTIAYEMKADRIRGGAKWLDTDRFDVIAKSPDVMSPHAMAAMLKTLLLQHFKLTTQTELEPVTVFALEAGGTPKLKPSDGSTRSECKLQLAQKGRTYSCRNTTMAQFIERLPDVTQAYLTHPLIDQTGLTGAYDFSLTWTPKDRLPMPTAQPSEGMPLASIPDGDLTIFEAVEKQLGLKITERQHPLPVIHLH